MTRCVIATFAAQSGALYAFVPSRTRPWGVYWDKAPEVVRWFTTRRAAEGFGRREFKGSVWFIMRGNYPVVEKGTIK